MAVDGGLDEIREFLSGRREGGAQLNALMAAARNREIDCVLVCKFDHIDTDSPVERAIFTIIGAMAELGSLLISERVTAGMRAAQERDGYLGRPRISQSIASEVEALATATDLSTRDIQKRIDGRASRGIVRKITKGAQTTPPPAL